jgi:hypothetical protein
MSSKEIIITIHFIDGEILKLSVTPTDAKMIGVSDDIERALQRNAMAVEIDNKLKIIPYDNVRYVDIDPAPDGLPLTVIQGAKQL